MDFGELRDHFLLIFYSCPEEKAAETASFVFVKHTVAKYATR
jgi:hypothetical protein